MKILKKFKGEYDLYVESKEDLWYLSQIIDPGDSVRGKTERKIKIGDSDANQRVIKKTITLEIAVDRVEFEKYGDNLRILGTVKSQRDDIPIGSHHTITLEKGSSFKITKSLWPKFQLDILKDSCESKLSPVLIVIHDREEAIFATLLSEGVKVLLRLKGNVMKKDDLEKGSSTKKQDFYSEVASNIESLNKEKKFSSIVLASPSFFKEYVYKVLPEEVKKNIVQSSSSSVSTQAINEVIKKPELKKALEKDRTSKELSLIENLLESIAKDLATYGINEVGKEAEIGAVSTLIVSDSYLRKNRQNSPQVYKKIENILKTVDKNKGDIFIVSSEDACLKVDSLGGIACITRWKT